jgi:hypothetical protein
MGANPQCRAMTVPTYRPKNGPEMTTIRWRATTALAAAKGKNLCARAAHTQPEMSDATAYFHTAVSNDEIPN